MSDDDSLSQKCHRRSLSQHHIEKREHTYRKHKHNDSFATPIYIPISVCPQGQVDVKVWYPGRFLVEVMVQKYYGNRLVVYEGDEYITDEYGTSGMGR